MSKESVLKIIGNGSSVENIRKAIPHINGLTLNDRLIILLKIVDNWRYGFSKEDMNDISKLSNDLSHYFSRELASLRKAQSKKHLDDGHIIKMAKEHFNGSDLKYYKDSDKLGYKELIIFILGAIVGFFLT